MRRNVTWVVLLAALAGGLASPSPAQEAVPGLPPPAPAAVERPSPAAVEALPQTGVEAPVPAAVEAPLPTAVEAPSPAAAEHSPTGGPTSRPDTEITLDLQSRLTAGIGFGGPLGAMGSVRLLHGLGADVRDGEGRVKAVCAVPIPHCAQGFTLQADAGSGGGKLSLGVGARARVEEPDFRGTVGAGLRLSLARTWGSPIGTDPGLTYLGPELDLSVVRVNLTLGVLWRVAGQGGASALFSWGVGFGL